MGFQEIATYAIGAVAAAWLTARWLRRRATGNCCGEKECPAAKGMLRQLEARRSGRETGGERPRPDESPQRARRG